MQPLLIPGAHLLRRDARHLQVGLQGGASVVLDRPAGSGSGLTDDPVVLSRLVRARLASADDRALRQALPPARTTGPEPAAPWVRHTIAALARRTADGLETALTHRETHDVVLQTFGHPLGAQLAEDLAELCGRTGLRVQRHRRSGPRARVVPARTLHVLVGVGEPSRDRVDPWLRAGLPHLVVRLVEGDAVVGPLVVPGHTACLRCIDAYLSEDDPAWPLLVEQYARASSADRADGIPEPVDAALAAVALGWAARDLASYAEGGDPTSLSSTVRLSPELDRLETRHWPMHPNCGCAWS